MWCSFVDRYESCEEICCLHLQVIKKVKVKVTLVQALTLCTGCTAHRGSRGIALPFHDHGTRRGWWVSVTPRPLLPPGKTRYPLYGRQGGPQGRSGQVRKISPPTGFDPRTVQPVASRYTDYATRPTYRLWLSRKQSHQVHPKGDFGFQPRCKWDIGCSGILRSIHWIRHTIRHNEFLVTKSLKVAKRFPPAFIHPEASLPCSKQPNTSTHLGHCNQSTLINRTVHPD